MFQKKTIIVLSLCFIACGNQEKKVVPHSEKKDIEVPEKKSVPDYKNPFNHTVSTAKGDLNKDGIVDIVVVEQDTLSDKAPYRLQVFFVQADGSKKLVVSSTKAIEAQFPNGREHHFYGNGFGQVSIQKGVLWLEYGMIRGHLEHKFRYQHGNLELIGYSYVESDGGGTITEIDFNLSTGDRLYREIDYHNDSIVKSEKKKIMIRPLPKLQDFEEFGDENKYY